MTDPALDLARWWPLLLWPAAVWFTIWSLRSTRPEPAPRLARWLAGLRVALWTALLVLLCGPRLRWSQVERRPAELAVLLDNSASLTFLQGRLDHRDWLPGLGGALDGMAVRVFAYDDGLRELAGDQEPVLPGDGVETDLDGALQGVERALQGRHWTGLLLVGDGNPTRGAWPLERVRRLETRVWTAGTGRRTPRADLVLRHVEANAHARLGREQPLEVELDAAGLAGRAAELVLREEGREQLRRRVTLPAEGAPLRVELGWTPRQAGNRLLQVEALLLGGGEASDQNNRRALQVRVEEARLPVLLLAGRPSQDLAFLRTALEARADIELSFAMPARPGSDRAALLRALAQTRLLVLVHWPPAGGADELGRALAARARQVPVLWLDGPGSSPEALQPGLARALGPPDPGPEEGVRALQVHPLLGPEERLDELQALLGELPPLQATRRGGGQTGARVLLEGRETGRPLLLVEEQAGLRRVWLPLTGLWRWGVGSQLSLGENHRARDLAGRLVDWLLAAPGQGLLQVRPDRESLPAGAPLNFQARLREETGEPRDGATLELDLQGPDSLARRLVLEPRGQGTYAGGLPALPAGAWSWRATARQGDRPQLADSGRVLVEERSPETLDAARNQRLLTELAQAGGGAALDLDAPADRARLADGSALDSLERRPLLERVGRQWELAGRGWVLAGLLLLIAGEWIWRRLSGLL
ncbi:MAG: hypothetical protein WC326_11685 [Candidatus Delongbacteria bacterium]